MDRLTQCRTCLAPNPYLFLPMGSHPPANMFVRPEQATQKQPAFQLNTQACLSCGLIQVADQIPADFFRHYLYVPSGAATMHTHFAELGRVIRERAGKGLIVDIGCNDGLLLSLCNQAGARTLGIDPAANLAKIANERGVDVHISYFDPDTANQVRNTHGSASVIVTTNTFNHIGNLHPFMEGVVNLLAEDGVFVIEVPWAKEILLTNEFDNVYHEHVSELSLLSIVKLGEQFGLSVVDVHRLSVHGGSMRVFLQRSNVGKVQPIVQEMLNEEQAVGILEAKTYDTFAARTNAIRDKLLGMLTDLRGQGLRIAGYGAPAKGNTLLNYFNIGTDYLEFLVDRNPLKQGLLSPGKLIPIKGVETIAQEKPDVLLVLAWNFFDEIRQQQAEWHAAGGRFLVPLPEPVLIDASGNKVSEAA